MGAFRMGAFRMGAFRVGAFRMGAFRMGAFRIGTLHRYLKLCPGLTLGFLLGTASGDRHNLAVQSNHSVSQPFRVSWAWCLGVTG
jgi:hypothetical protein